MSREVKKYRAVRAPRRSTSTCYSRKHVFSIDAREGREGAIVATLEGRMSAPIVLTGGRQIAEQFGTPRPTTLRFPRIESDVYDALHQRAWGYRCLGGRGVTTGEENQID